MFSCFIYFKFKQRYKLSKQNEHVFPFFVLNEHILSLFGETV